MRFVEFLLKEKLIGAMRSCGLAENIFDDLKEIDQENTPDRFAVRWFAVILFYVRVISGEFGHLARDVDDALYDKDFLVFDLTSIDSSTAKSIEKMDWFNLLSFATVFNS